MLRCGFMMFCAFLQGVVLYTEECATLTSKGPRAWMFGKALYLETPWRVCLCRVWCACGTRVLYTVLLCVHLPVVC
jgi:hypothetical protein